MKIKTICSLLAFSALIFIAGCGGSSSPSSVAQKWCSAIAAANCNAANEHSTDRVKEVNEMYIEMCQDIKADKPQPKGAVIKLKKAVDLNTVKIISEKINGDSATVDVQDGRGNKGKIGFIKVNGQWKVNDPCN